jgi:hypothetical protein
LDFNKYRPIVANDRGWLWSETLGFFLGIHDRQLRYFSLEGALLPTPQEAAKNEMLAANQARQIAEQERQTAEQAKAELQELKTKMRSLGIDLNGKL